jgi:hypothetical protein
MNSVDSVGRLFGGDGDIAKERDPSSFCGKNWGPDEAFTSFHSSKYWGALLGFLKI